MADRRNGNNDDRPGYGNTPSWTRWRKGESGNPKGRPKGTGKKQMTAKQPVKLTEFEKLLHDLLAEEATLTLNGRKVSVSRKRALLLNLLKQAMSGNPVAIREVNRLTEKLETKQEALARAEAEAADQAAQEQAKQDEALFSYLVELKDKQSTAWAKAAAEGKDEPAAPWPHPDDILIDYAGRKARVRGPICGESVADWEYSRRRRDHYLARMVLAGYSDEPSASVLTKVWLACLAEEDQHLPRRWQILHDLGPATARLLAMRLPRLVAIVAAGAAEFERSRPGAPQSKASYQRQNRVWGPLAKALGYRSLRHFERTFEDAGLPA